MAPADGDKRIKIQDDRSDLETGFVSTFRPPRVELGRQSRPLPRLPRRPGQLTLRTLRTGEPTPGYVRSSMLKVKSFHQSDFLQRPQLSSMAILDQ